MTRSLPEDYNCWTNAALVAALFAINPFGTCGINLRARPGPIRDAWLEQAKSLFPSKSVWRKVPVNVSDSRLTGGLDLVATLESGKPVLEHGLLAEANNGILLLAMSERLTTRNAAQIGNVIDLGEVIMERDGLKQRTKSRFGIIALDEGNDDDEYTPKKIQERFAFSIDLESVNYQQSQDWLYKPDLINTARTKLNTISFTPDYYASLCTVALSLGIQSMRAPILAMRVAQAAAALDDSSSVKDEHIHLASRLVYMHRATQLPVTEEAQQTEQQEQQQQLDNNTESAEDNDNQVPDNIGEIDDIVLTATQVALSKRILENLNINLLKNQNRGTQGRSNIQKYSYERGRPMTSRQGTPAAGVRLHVIDTLRAAAPWQRLRRNEQTQSVSRNKLAFRKEDFRICRFKQRTVSTTLFIVDASGSSALNRLSEAKGAVELLLAECYQRRDQVALIAYRGRTAELILPPTRSLIRAKRLLAGLPGGGATPLASGLNCAASLARQIITKGEMLSLILLTDGRPNISLDGVADRKTAEQDAINSARELSVMQVSSLLIDTSPRSQQCNQKIADALNAQYITLPNADANKLSNTIKNQLPARSSSQQKQQVNKV